MSFEGRENKLNHSGCLLRQILFHCFVCLCIRIFYSFYYPTLSLLCLFQSYNDNLFYGWTSSCFFICQNIIIVSFAIRNKAALRTLMQIYLAICMALHIYFLARFARSAFKTCNNTFNKMYCTIRYNHKSIHHKVFIMLTSLLNKKKTTAFYYNFYP